MGEVKRKDPIQGDIVHEYDEILEADNALPNWLSVIFIGTAVFAVGYWFAYEKLAFLEQPGQAYAAQMAARAASGGEVSAYVLDTLSHDQVTVASGRQLFTANCVACHDTRAQGKIGPNLTDEYWIHGGASTDVYATIKTGVLAKGMPAWGASLGERSAQQLTAFVLSIRNTHVPGKPPQGERWNGGAAPNHTSPAKMSDAPPTTEPDHEASTRVPTSIAPSDVHAL